MTDQPVGEYPDITQAQTMAGVCAAIDTSNTTSFNLLREAHRDYEELRRRNVALDAKLDAALADRDRWRAAASTGSSAP